MSMDAVAANGRCSFLTLGSETLPNHHSPALPLLQLMDYAWFQDNFFKPNVRLVDALLLLPSSQLISSHQSIELTDAAHSKWAAPLSSQNFRCGSMPRARFEIVPSSLALCKTSDSGHALVPDIWPHRPLPGAHALVSKQHSCWTSHTDTVSIPPTASLHAWLAKDFRNHEGFEESENLQAGKLNCDDRGKQLRVLLMDGQLRQPSLRLLGAKRAQRKNSSKSMTACGFDELQGFHLNEEEDLAPQGRPRMFPGRRSKLEEAGAGSVKVPRTLLTKPKQSSVMTWLVRQSSTPLHQGQIAATREDMKEHLRFWARAVALTVRQEC